MIYNRERSSQVRCEVRGQVQKLGTKLVSWQRTSRLRVEKESEADNNRYLLCDNKRSLLRK